MKGPMTMLREQLSHMDAEFAKFRTVFHNFTNELSKNQHVSREQQRHQRQRAVASKHLEIAARKVVERVRGGAD